MEEMARGKRSKEERQGKKRWMMQATRDKAYKGVGMEGRVATWYASNTAKDMAEFRSLADRLAKELPSGSCVLEVAPGPGYLAVELARRGRYEISGLDISKTFVEIATANARKASVRIDFQQGNACAMPFGDDTFDLVVCRAAFKNFSDPIEAMNEMHRVLKPGARALIIDLRKDAPMEAVNAYIKKSDLGWMNSLIYRLTFRYMLLPRAYTKEEFREMASGSRFAGAEIVESGIGYEITLRK
jgi:ubiquinone/menaquinone biosynthesis C-methylase UbiE